MKKLSKCKLAVAVALVATGVSGELYAKGDVPIAVSAITADELRSLPPQSISDAIKNGSVNLSLRYRYENVDDDVHDDAGASTLKSRITFTTQSYNHWQAQVEVDDVTVIGGENYDDLHGTNTDHAVVADPEGTEVNQVWLSYSGFDNTLLKAGRQRINLDNQRFIGGVGWRQNEQTYDAFSVLNTSHEDTTIYYAFIDNVNRIFGPDDGRSMLPLGKRVADLDTSANLLNINYKGCELGTLSAYAYLLDVTEDGGDGMSTKTYGARFSGARGESTKFLYTAEYAKQTDYADNPGNFDVKYYNLEGGVQVAGITAKLGREVLGSDDGDVAFQTPLATLHKFQGFADMFLVTPADGIEDDYVSVFTKVAGVKLGAIYHDFSADEGSDDHGKEWNLVASKKINKNVDVALKFASFSADSSFNSGNDVKKAWLQVGVKF